MANINAGDSKKPILQTQILRLNIFFSIFVIALIPPLQLLNMAVLENNNGKHIYLFNTECHCLA